MQDRRRLTKIQIRRRKKIIEAAMVVLGRDRSLNLDKIIKLSGGSKGAIYDFFGNKRGLEAAIGDEVYQRLEALTVKILKDLDPLLAGDELEKGKLKLCLKKLFKTMNAKKAREAMGLLLHNLPKRDEFMQRFYGEGPEGIVRNLTRFLKRVAKKEGVPLTAPRRCALVVFGMIFGPHMLDIIFSVQSKQLKGDELDAYADWVTVLLLHGFLEGAVERG